jgi:hypothetical protein
VREADALAFELEHTCPHRALEVDLGCRNVPARCFENDHCGL